MYHKLTRLKKKPTHTIYAGIPQSQIETIIPKNIPKEPTNNNADMRVMTDHTINAIFPENKGILTPKANTSFHYNFLTRIPKIPITEGERSKTWVEPNLKM